MDTFADDRKMMLSFCCHVLKSVRLQATFGQNDILILSPPECATAVLICSPYVSYIGFRKSGN